MSSPDLPALVRTYVDAKNAHDVEGQLACFAAAATVVDEGETHVGTAAIRAWLERVTGAYDLTVDPTGWVAEGDGGVMTAEVSGTFPGSPLEFRYHLTLEDGLLTSLRPEA